MAIPVRLRSRVRNLLLVETGKLVKGTFAKAAAGAEHLVAIANGEMLCNKA